MNKKYTVLGLLTAISLVLPVLLLVALGNSSTRLDTLKKTHEEILALKSEHLLLKEKLVRIKNKKHLTSIKGLSQAVDEIFVPLGLKQKVRSVKELGDKNPMRQKAEVLAEGLSMNETVNFLHSLKQTPMPLSLKRINIRTSFPSPGRLDLSMTLVFLNI